MDTQTATLQHLGASLALFDALARAGGGHPFAPAVRAFLDQPGRVGPSAEPFAMKYDGYLAAGERAAWGFTINSRYDPRPVQDFVDEAAQLVQAPRMTELAGQLATLLPRPGITTLSFAFDSPARAPRLKVYFQEDRWGEGVGSVAEVNAALAELELGCALPSWVAGDQGVGVLTLEAPPQAGLRAKAYLGAGDNSEGVFAGAPEEVPRLSATMREACPLSPAYYYLTLRMERDRPVRYAVNKIYDIARMQFGKDAQATLDAYRDLAKLFAAAGKLREFRKVVAELRAPVAGGRAPLVVPTASAVEDEGRSVDFYCAAFST
jgi:hypothetical protein